MHETKDGRVMDDYFQITGEAEERDTAAEGP
jgi:hypothetical protein